MDGLLSTYKGRSELHERNALSIIVPKPDGSIGTRSASADDHDIFVEDVGVMTRTNRTSRNSRDSDSGGDAEHSGEEHCNEKGRDRLTRTWELMVQTQAQIIRMGGMAIYLYPVQHKEELGYLVHWYSRI